MDGSSMGAVSLSNSTLASNSAIQEAFSLPWEEDFLTSSKEKVSGSGVADSVEVPVSEVSPAKIVCCPHQVPSLIRRGFFGPRTVSPSPSWVKEASLSSKGKDPPPENGLIRLGFLGLNFGSSSLLEKLSKQDAKVDDGEVLVCSIVSFIGAVV
jgi:hypothetical protein